MKKLFIIFISVVFTAQSTFLISQEMEAFWTLVFAGDNITTPVFSQGNIYTAGADKAINCITSRGTFLWRRNTKNYPTPLISTSIGGVVYLVTRGNYIEAYSSQGMPIWTYKCPEMPLFPVYIAKDGYLLITFQKHIIALTRQGKLKWDIPLPATPTKEPIEVAQKNIILLLDDGSFLRISMFGKLLEQLSLKKSINTIAFAPDGYLVSCRDNTLSYYKVGESSTLIWQLESSSPCYAITHKEDVFLCVYENGNVSAKKVRDGSDVWSLDLLHRMSEAMKCENVAGEFQIRDKGFGAVIASNGKIKWQKELVEKQFLPIITENGLLIGIKREILNAYRMETKLLRKDPKRVDLSKGGSQSDGSENEDYVLHKATVLYLLGFSTFNFFSDVEQDLKNGNVAGKEDYYAIMLTGIIQNEAKSAYFPHEFSSFERARAATLLGQMGLYQYRDVLLNQISVSMDVELAIGVLKGLTALAYDPDGKTLDGITFILNKNSPDNVELIKSVVDAFYALSKFGDKVTAKKAVENLFSIMNGAYPAVIKEYVRQKVKNLV